MPQEVVQGFLEHAEELLGAGPSKQAVLAFMAGSFITFGAVLSVVLTIGIEQDGLSRLLLGLGFSVGFALVILSGAALFTEVNVLLPELFLSSPRQFGRRYLRFWLIVYLGNIAGALFVGVMIKAAHVLAPVQQEHLFDIMSEKLRFQDLGTEGWFVVIASGVIGNWLVGMAAFLATAGRTLPGKIMGITLPIVAFVALGVQHSPANMGYFSVGLIEGGSGIDWLDAVWWSIVPATIGNILGGSLLVALLFWYTYGHRKDQRAILRRADQFLREEQR